MKSGESKLRGLKRKQDGEGKEPRGGRGREGLPAAGCGPAPSIANEAGKPRERAGDGTEPSLRTRLKEGVVLVSVCVCLFSSYAKLSKRIHWQTHFFSKVQDFASASSTNSCGAHGTVSLGGPLRAETEQAGLFHLLQIA